MWGVESGRTCVVLYRNEKRKQKALKIARRTPSPGDTGVACARHPTHQCPSPIVFTVATRHNGRKEAKSKRNKTKPQTNQERERERERGPDWHQTTTPRPTTTNSTIISVSVYRGTSTPPQGKDLSTETTATKTNSLQTKPALPAVCQTGTGKMLHDRRKKGISPWRRRRHKRGAISLSPCVLHINSSCSSMNESYSRQVRFTSSFHWKTCASVATSQHRYPT